LGATEEEYELHHRLGELASQELNGRQIGTTFLNAKQLAKHRGKNLGWEDLQSALKTDQSSMTSIDTDEEIVKGRRLRY
jgi:hypothetical protein